jgi:lipoprotein-anchoring transpeptidase ErfK/SrfK
MRNPILMATIALGAMLATTGAQAQMFAFLTPPSEQQAAPQAVEPQPAEPSEDAQLPDRLRKQIVDYRGKEAAGTIIVDTPHTYLYLVLGNGKALRYGIGVGREGFTWSGSHPIVRKAEWPDWYPPEEMRERDGRLPEKMTGGIKNPLGAMALYLGNSLYRIHGTNDAKSIGQAASSGCFRMLNAHIVDLAGRVEVGTPVTVVHRLPPELDRVVAQQVRDPYRPRASRSIERF